MSYDKQTWKNGDVITEQKLNHMEDGIDNAGILIVASVIDGQAITLDHTWQEIYDAPFAIVIAENEQGEDVTKVYCPIVNIVKDSGVCSIEVTFDETPTTFSCDSADGYPTYSNK